MPAFSFEAVDAQGQVRRGTLDADSPRAARSTLRAQALVPLSVEVLAAGMPEDAAPSLSQRLLTRPAFNAAELAVWTRQLAGLAGAGLPLERALAALAEEAENEAQRNVVAALRAEVNGGSTFARALSLYPREFSSIYIAVVGAGEASGSLSQVLERLADDLEARQALRAKVWGAALYPAIVTVVAVVIVLFLVGYVVPQVASVFAGTQRSLPFLTVLMLAISDFVRHFGGYVLLAGCASAWAARLALARPQLRERFDRGWLRLPLIGKLARGYNAARFAATLAMLAGAGVPILKALQAAAQTLNNQALRADAQDALALVREGAPLASALAQKKRFPPLLSMFARLGEQTGNLPQMLERAANQLGNEVQRRALHMATLLEPLLIVSMGLVVMLIVLAVLLPIIELNQLVK